MSHESVGDSEVGRVRFCAACGEAVAFHRRACPSCGHHEPLARPVDAGPTEPCPLCGKPAPSGLVFCPSCGRERGGEPEPSFSPSEQRTGQADVRGLRALVLVLTGAGPLALAAAAAYLLL